jgi:hypothetical protein
LHIIAVLCGQVKNRLARQGLRQAVCVQNIHPCNPFRKGLAGGFINNPKAFARLLQRQA